MTNQKVRRVVKRRKKKKRPILKLIITVASLLLISGCIYSVYVVSSTWQAANKTYDDLDRERSKLRTEAVTVLDDPVSILIMGVEDYSTGGTSGRSDSLMLATFNPDDTSMNILSIPRDTRVELAEEGTMEKINHAYAYGGKENTIETVENFLDIPVDYYVTINFEAFKEIVDGVGGITVDVPFDFTEISDDGMEILKFSEGAMKLDGREALAYARMRKQDPLQDIGRIERQKQVVMAVVDKLTSVNTLLRIDKIAGAVGDNVETNLKVSDAIGFYQKYSNFNSSNIETLTLEGQPNNTDYHLDYYIANEEALEELKKELKSHLGQY
ncbi:LCP family protein [Bacillus carboniphilus]|uniref:LCP family protein n=1 Tax=Bacillus carboniphilus TaxID=86663 RepID=A0ABY9JQ25_9BACI|nr:LCP family protein [Bacillus carboniphilus]WLR41499.1 LCP family protein [Bacillus carboniphilus]